MTTGRYLPLQTASTLSLSGALFGVCASLRGKRDAGARPSLSANGSAATTAMSLWAGISCEERGATTGVLANHLDLGGFKAINGTILFNGGQSDSDVAYTPLGNLDRNALPGTTKYRCWSLRDGLPSRQ